MTRLGRGLDALIKTGPESIDRSTGLTTVKLKYIIPNRFQPRKAFNQEKLQELANSLKKNGIIQPIIVTKRKEDLYEIIAGERRFEAAKLAEFEEISVIIRSVSSQEQLQYAIIENVQREDLNAVEEAKAYQQLHDEFNLTHIQISEIVGKDRATISNFIRLLKLNENIQLLLLESKIYPGHARAILQVDEDLQESFAELIETERYSVRKAEVTARKINKTGKMPQPKATGQEREYYSELEYKLMDRFKTRIRISERNHKGRVCFYFNSQKDFNKLIKELEK